MKSFFTFLSAISFFILIPFYANSQDPHTHEKKVYVDDENKTYWNKSLPVYIKLSTSPEGENGHVLKSDTMPDFTEPFYFDTEGANYLRTRWAVDKKTGKTIYPQREILWDVYADGKSPVTIADYKFTGKKIVNGKTYYSKDLIISLSASDNVSGVENIYYSLNGDSFKEYNGEIIPAVQGDWTFSFYAVDKVGNSEADRVDWKSGKNHSNSLKFIIDNTAPVTTIVINDPTNGDIASPKSILRFTSEDKDSGVEEIYYSINDSGPKSFNGNIYLSSLPEGDYTITYYAIDAVANIEDFKSYSFFLDKTAPEIQLAFNGDQFETHTKTTYISERTLINLSGSDEKAGIESISYQFDGTEYQSYNSDIHCNLKQGKHTIYYYGIDKVENKNKESSKFFIVDTTAPVIVYDVEGPKYERQDTIFLRDISKIKTKPYESGYYQSGINAISYQVGDQSNMTYDKPFNLDRDGYHNLTLSVTDQVNNESTMKVNLYGDNNAPDIFHHFSVEPIGNKTIKDDKFNIYPSHVMVYLAATDKEVGSKEIYYTINGGKEQRYVKPIEYLKSGVNFNIEVRALDYLGNERKETIRFSVEDYLVKK